MKLRKIKIGNIPTILWGEPSDKMYIFVHGKMSNKESAQEFAEIAVERGYQVLSFDLPEHGERKDTNYKCNVWNGTHDLEVIGTYAQENWTEISLFACSLGAYFSLIAYKNLLIKKCLFQSPILDMEHLIGKMFKWFNVTEEQLREKKEIFTPIDILSWDYYCYVKEYPIDKWDIPTAIIYGTEDNLQDREVIDSFTNKFHSDLTISKGSEHSFHTKEQSQAVTQWLRKYI
ncbi:alpha/beta hydrolase [Clostridium sp. BL-8]|uniref:alpha/beta hydrolase n=1 Tax=Clostridium sp. BL-8 TaxID=349938 RepID=UPI00098C6517|nr:alpha/beta hydrolase [Clostridium sp. BL-8]OOM80157.1 alpha/beta hydrolase family protein [Clostridium sp. BL-8]